MDMQNTELNESQAQAEMREIIIEQHKGRWVYSGNEDDKNAIEKHDEFVSQRVRRGIQLTAFLRGIQAQPKAAKGVRSAGKSKSSIVAAIDEDLLS